MPDPPLPAHGSTAGRDHLGLAEHVVADARDVRETSSLGERGRGLYLLVDRRVRPAAELVVVSAPGLDGRTVCPLITATVTSEEPDGTAEPLTHTNEAWA